MSSSDAIKQLFGALQRHHETISRAYLIDNKQISVSEETEAAVNGLLKQKLAWHLDEFEGVQLSSKLVALLDQAVRSERRLQISDSVGRLWVELDGHLADYKVSRHEYDKDVIKLSLQECAHDLIEEIDQAVGRYARFIDRGYAFAQSIEVRLQQNERVLKRATELAEMMESCDLSEYQQATGDDPLLRKLFCRFLPQAFERARKEFRRAIGDLQALITKIREEQELSGLIHCFQNQYERDPGFVPSQPAILGGMPPAINLAEPLLTRAAPNIYVDSHLMELGELVQKLKIDHSVSDTTETPRAPKLNDNREQLADPLQMDELFEASQASIEWVLDSGESQMASGLYTKLEIVESYDLWLYALVNTIHGLEVGTQRALSIEFEELPDPVFTGNRIIVDIKMGINIDG